MYNFNQLIKEPNTFYRIDNRNTEIDLTLNNFEQSFRNNIRKQLDDQMKIYINDMLIGSVYPTSTNFNTSTFTKKDMEDAYNLVNQPQEVNVSFENSKIDQFQFAQLMGMKVIEQEIIKEYIQVKKHKKKRINKKWLKRYGVLPVYDDNCYIFNNTLIGNPKEINRIRESCRIS